MSMHAVRKENMTASMHIYNGVLCLHNLMPTTLFKIYQSSPEIKAI